MPGELQGVAHGGPILASEYLNAGGPVQYFRSGGNAEPTAEDIAFGAVAPEVGQPESSSVVDPDQQAEIALSEAIENPSRATIAHKSSTQLDEEDLDPENPLTTPLPNLPFTPLDVLRTAVTIAIPPLALPNAALTAVQALNALNEGKTPPGIVGLVSPSTLPGFLEGTLDIENPEEPAEQESVFADSFGVVEGGQ
jgi:hypothetical protein